MKKKWCKKLVCGCTHWWQDTDTYPGVNEAPFTGGLCRTCGYFRWVYTKPHHYKVYRKSWEDRLWGIRW